MIKHAEFIGTMAVLVLALSLLTAFVFVYWLLASWLVDSVFKFDGWGAVLTKLVLFWIIFGFGASLRISSKGKGE